MCDLCVLEKRTEWFFENSHFVIIECDTCRVPVVVWRIHETDVEDADLTGMKMEAVKVARSVFGENNWVFDMERRKILDHFHFHIRKVD